MNTDTTLQEISLDQYIALTMDKWRVWTAAAAVAAVLAGICSLFVVPAQYRAGALMVTTGQIAAGPHGIQVIETLPIQIPGEVKSEAELCRHILETRVVRREVVEECGLRATLAGHSTQETAERLARRTRVSTEWPNLVTLTVTLPGPPAVSLAGLRGGRLQARDIVVKVVNAYVAALDKSLNQMHLTAAKRKRVFLREQKQEIQDELAAAEEALQRWEAIHGVMQLEVAGKALVEELMGLQQAAEEARVDLRTAKKWVATLEQQLVEQPEMATASVVQQANPLVAKLYEKLVELETELAVATRIEKKTEQHPEVRATRQESASTREALAEEQRRAMFEASRTEVASPVARRLQDDLLASRVNKAALEARIAGLGVARERAEADVARLSGEALEYGRLLRTVKMREKLFETLTEEYEQALIEERATEPAVHVVDEPVAPERPEGPGLAVRILFGGLIGGLTGWVWVMGSGGRSNRKAVRGGRQE